MGLKLGQNINFRLFFRFLNVSSRDSLLGRDTGRDILLVATLVATYSPGRDTIPVATYFLSRHTS